MSTSILYHGWGLVAVWGYDVSPDGFSFLGDRNCEVLDAQLKLWKIWELAETFVKETACDKAYGGN